ncbi:MAG: transglutaminase domain-containing protein, partial [Abitibacteriaceae bacterium]|nr:transglutaminase domain-containing protein [Abditibacteriaceae bacterium]
MQRLPITATIATFIAFVALYLAPGGFFLGPILALALLATYAVDAWLDLKSPLTQIIRFTLFGIVLVPAFGRYTGDNGDPIELILAHAFGELAACELVLQAWLKRPVGGQRGAISVFLASFALMGASNTFDTNYIRFLVPAYMLFLILSLREFRTPQETPPNGFSLPDINLYKPNGRVRSWSWLALFVAVMSGATFHFGVLYYRNQINDIGLKLLGDREPPQTSGISTTPTLGDTFGATGSLTRMLRIENFSGQPYLRAMAFDHYEHGTWGPGVNMRSYLPITRQQVGADAPGHHMTINRLVDDNQLVFTPLNAAGIAAPPHTELEWAPTEGGPLRSIEPVPYPFIYDVILDPNAAHQGPLGSPPTLAQRQKDLEVAKEVDPQVHELARRIGDGLSNPVEQVEAVQEYLMTHHSYSLSTQAGQGDPISNFLLQRKAAHCEYFASAATILLRCLGVPTRYVIGYYVHEMDSPNVAIVRGRDAHAWAESWVDGIGWVTVDATPGGGRPDHTAQPLPFSFKLREHLQDYLALLRDKL